MRIIEQTFSGLDILEMIKKDKIGCGEIIRHKREDVVNQDGTPVYEYYKFTGWDKKFHRCNEKGKLGVKGQERFMNYNTIYKDFEFVILEDKEEVEENNFTGLKMYQDGKVVWFINHSIPEVEDKEYEDIEEITYKPRKVQNAINALIRNQKYIL